MWACDGMGRRGGGGESRLGQDCVSRVMFARTVSSQGQAGEGKWPAGGPARPRHGRGGGPFLPEAFGMETCGGRFMTHRKPPDTFCPWNPRPSWLCPCPDLCAETSRPAPGHWPRAHLAPHCCVVPGVERPGLRSWSFRLLLCDLGKRLKLSELWRACQGSSCSEPSPGR